MQLHCPLLESTSASTAPWLMSEHSSPIQRLSWKNSWKKSQSLTLIRNTWKSRKISHQIPSHLHVLSFSKRHVYEPICYLHRHVQRWLPQSHSDYFTWQLSLCSGLHCKRELQVSMYFGNSPISDLGACWTLLDVRWQGSSHLVIAAARMPILVSFGGKDECPGSFSTVKFSVIEPFSVIAILSNDKEVND